MADTHPIIILIAGLIVTGFSLYIGEQFKLFFYIGLVFIAYAVVKWTILSYSSDKKHKESIKYEKAKKLYELSHQPKQQQKKFQYCKNCGSIVNISDNFCYKCGFKLR